MTYIFDKVDSYGDLIMEQPFTPPLFVCGWTMADEILQALIGRVPSRVPARAVGFRQFRGKYDVFPTIVRWDSTTYDCFKEQRASSIGHRRDEFLPGMTPLLKDRGFSPLSTPRCDRRESRSTTTGESSSPDMFETRISACVGHHSLSDDSEAGSPGGPASHGSGDAIGKHSSRSGFTCDFPTTHRTYVDGQLLLDLSEEEMIILVAFEGERCQREEILVQCSDSDTLGNMCEQLIAREAERVAVAFVSPPCLWTRIDESSVEVWNYTTFRKKPRSRSIAMH